MDKQEAMQTHRTLMTAVQTLANGVDEVDLSKGDLTQYNEVGVKPTDLHKKRADHEEAILALSDDVATILNGGDSSEVEEKEPVEA